jgi:uncharacterized lipoprotein YmbA
MKTPTTRSGRKPAMKGGAALAPLLALFFTTGCSFLSSKPSQFYTLDRIPPAGAIANVAGLPIGVTVVLPPGLDRKEIAVRKENHQFEIRGREQWTATLEPLVLHTLAFDLASRLPDGMVILPGQTQPGGTMRNLDVVVEELAAGPGQSLVLDARWSMEETVPAVRPLPAASPRTSSAIVAGPKSPVLAGHEHIAIDLTSLDSAGVATATSQAIAALADRIVTQLR